MSQISTLDRLALRSAQILGRWAGLSPLSQAATTGFGGDGIGLMLLATVKGKAPNPDRDVVDKMAKYIKDHLSTRYSFNASTDYAWSTRCSPATRSPSSSRSRCGSTDAALGS